MGTFIVNCTSQIGLLYLTERGQTETIACMDRTKLPYQKFIKFYGNNIEVDIY